MVSPILPADKMRSFMALAMFGGGVVCTLLAVASVLIVWLGGWAAEQQALQLQIIAAALVGFLLGMLLVLVSLAVGGPLGRLKLNASRDGIGLEAAGDGEPVEPTQAVSAPETSGAAIE